MTPGIDLLKNTLTLGEVIVGKIANTKEFVKTITLVSLEETSVLQTFIDGENNE